MIPLRCKTTAIARFPEFLIPRLVVDVAFEPVGDVNPMARFFDSALIDTGAGYLTIPYRVHQFEFVKIHQDFGLRPYRIISDKDAPVLQRFVEVGFHLLVKQPDGKLAYWPEHYVKAKAFLLDEQQRPNNKVLVGLDVLLEHFITHVESNDSFLAARAATTDTAKTQQG